MSVVNPLQFFFSFQDIVNRIVCIFFCVACWYLSQVLFTYVLFNTSVIASFKYIYIYVERNGYVCVCLCVCVCVCVCVSTVPTRVGCPTI